MLPGFVGNTACIGAHAVTNKGASPGPSGQGVALSGIPQPGCVTECHCSLFSYKCYDICDGRVVRVWDNGWCVSW